MQKNSDNKVKINNFFIIHLDRATKRKKQVNFLKNIIPFKVSIISAVDGHIKKELMFNQLGIFGYGIR